MSEIIYTLEINHNEKHQYEFQEIENRLHFVNKEDFRDSEWTNLTYNQCPNCTLSSDTTGHCPIALNLGGLLKDWNNTLSYTPVKLTVVTAHRTVFAETTAQKALSSLIGLVMATSDCPHTQFFRAMAQFHLPLASSEETSFRAISTYLLLEYFKKQEGKSATFDLDGLAKIYEDMHELNIHVKKRFMAAVENDAALNAVTVLDIFTITTTNFLDEELEKLRGLFSLE